MNNGHAKQAVRAADSTVDFERLPQSVLGPSLGFGAHMDTDTAEEPMARVEA
jgi:hypothetical protein